MVVWVIISAIVFSVVPVSFAIRRRAKINKINKEAKSFGLESGYDTMPAQVISDCLAIVSKDRRDRSNLRLITSRLQWQYKNNCPSYCALICEKDGGEIIFVFPEEGDPKIFYKKMEKADGEKALKKLLDLLWNQ
jgi:hypothetical protein